SGSLEDFVGQALRLGNSRTASDALALQRRSGSLTADYLSGRKSIPVPKPRRKSTSMIKITGAREHNLKNIDVDLPLAIFTCATGSDVTRPDRERVFVQFRQRPLRALFRHRL